MRICCRPESVSEGTKAALQREGGLINSSVNLFMQFVEPYSARCSARVTSTVYGYSG